MSEPIDRGAWEWRSGAINAPSALAWRGYTRDGSPLPSWQAIIRVDQLLGKVWSPDMGVGWVVSRCVKARPSKT